MLEPAHQLTIVAEEIPDAIFREHATLQVAWQQACLIGGKVLPPVFAAIIFVECGDALLSLHIFVECC